MKSRIESQYLGNLTHRSRSVGQKVLGFVETYLQLILFGTKASSSFEYLPKIRVADLQFVSELLHEDGFVVAASNRQLSFLNLFVDRPAKFLCNCCAACSMESICNPKVESMA